MAATKVRIAVQSARELEIEVDDGDAVVAQLEAAVDAGGGIAWVVDSDGTRHGIAVDKLAFIEIEGTLGRRGVGFGAPPLA